MKFGKSVLCYYLDKIPSGPTWSPTTTKTSKPNARSIPVTSRPDPSANASRSLTGSLSRELPSPDTAPLTSLVEAAVTASSATSAVVSSSSTFSFDAERSRPHSAQPTSHSEDALDFVSSLPALNLGRSGQKSFNLLSKCILDY